MQGNALILVRGGVALIELRQSMSVASDAGFLASDRTLIEANVHDLSEQMRRCTSRYFNVKRDHAAPDRSAIAHTYVRDERLIDVSE